MLPCVPSPVIWRPRENWLSRPAIRCGANGRRETVRLPDGSSVEVHNDIRPVAGELVTYETHFRFGPDDTAVGADTLRFMNQARLTRHLMDAGLSSLTWYGDWDGSAVSSSSPELIVICQP